MEKFKNLILAASAIGVIVLAFVVSQVKPVTVTQNGEPPSQQPSSQPSTVGGINPVINSDYLCVGGVCKTYRHEAFQTGTTTVCALQAPAATSTIVELSVNQGLTNGSGTTSLLRWTIAMSPNQYATTTKIMEYTAVASTTFTLSGATGTPVISPNWYVTVGADGKTGTDLKLASTVVGACDAVFLWSPF